MITANPVCNPPTPASKGILLYISVDIKIVNLGKKTTLNPEVQSFSFALQYN